MNTRTQATVATLPGTEQAQQIAVSNDERELAIASTGNGGDGIVSLWNTTTWKRIATFATFSGLEISALAFSPDNTQLALGAGDGTAGVWSLRTHEQLASYLGPTSAVISLAFSPDGRELAAAIERRHDERVAGKRARADLHRHGSAHREHRADPEPADRGEPSHRRWRKRAELVAAGSPAWRGDSARTPRRRLAQP
jgi:dipeptidyl aminopeptidase/acylaminoacyl peptidase